MVLTIVIIIMVHACAVVVADMREEGVWGQ